MAFVRFSKLQTTCISRPCEQTALPVIGWCGLGLNATTSSCAPVTRRGRPRTCAATLAWRYRSTTLGAVSLRITVGLNRPGRPPLRGLEDPLAVKASLEDGDFGLQIPDHTIEFVRTGRIPGEEAWVGTSGSSSRRRSSSSWLGSAADLEAKTTWPRSGSLFPSRSDRQARRGPRLRGLNHICVILRGASLLRIRLAGPGFGGAAV